MRKRGLAKTLTIAFVAVSAVVMLISGCINIYNNLLCTHKLTVKQQQLIAKDASEKVKSYIQDKIISLSSVESVFNLSASGIEEQKSVFGKLLSRDSAIRQIAFIDMQSNEITKVSRLSKTAVGQLTNEHKKDVVQNIGSSDSYISEVYFDDKTFEPMIIMAIPAKNEDGKSIGFLVAEVNLKFMWDLISTIKVGENGIAYVVDRKGELLAFRDTGRVIKGENLSKLKKVAEFINHEEGSENGVYFSKGILGKYAVIDYISLEYPDWAVITELPIREAYHDVMINFAVSILAMIISFIFATLLGLYLSKRITKPIINLKNATKLLSKGNLNAKIDVNSKNEIGELASDFNQMAVNIGNLIINIKNTVKVILEQSTILRERANQSALSAQAVVTSMEQISVGADDQANEANKTTSQTSILGEKIDHVVNKAEEVEKITGFTKDVSIKSKDTVELLIQRAKETDRITKMLLENTQQLYGSLGKIRGIADAISTITNKTKMLSLNAKIEASRAGEAGLGFAVIVNEISKLADQSQEAAQMIDPILKDIQVQTEVSANISEKANNIVEEQMQSVFSTQSAFDEIISSMDNAIREIVEMNDIIKNIEVFKENCIKSVMTISSVTQETAASCQEVTAASEEQKAIADEVKSFANSLYEMGEKLAKLTDTFKTEEE